MLNFPPTVRVFLCVIPIDMRRSFDTLSELVREQIGEDPLSGHLFLFRNKEETKIKILYWDHDGFAIWYKRLEKGTFSLPRNVGGKVEMDSGAFGMLLSGFDIKSIKKQARFSASAGRSFSGASV